ncbi:MAG: ABC transporter ATP-binding protein/permease [Sphingobacteriales bacterium]|nr:ABC transporter ATP-binding protein/permease [Sphingobacteriales bacterium]
MSSVSGKAIDTKILRRIYQYLQPYKKVFWMSVGLTVLLAIVAPIRPYLIQYTIDNFILADNANGLFTMVMIMFGLLAFQTIIQYYHTVLTNWLGQSAILDLRKLVFSHLLSLRLKYFDNTPIGTLVTRAVSDLETIADVFSEGLIVIIGDILQIVVIVGVMMYIDWRLTLISLATIPFLLIATYIFKERTKKAFQDVRVEVAKLNTFLQEHISGMRIIQLFVREKAEMEKFKNINRRHRIAHIKSVWYYSIFFPVVELMSATSIGLLVWYGSKEVLDGSLSLGVIVSFIMYINMLFRPIRELADKFNTLQMGMVSSERIFSVLDTQEQTPNHGTITDVPVQGKITFDKVRFAYTEDHYVLKNISFELQAGKTLAIVGATGAGKSSIINLLNRFYEINEGEIRVDDIDIKKYELSFLRSKIATVLQDVFLFSDTIAENIRLKNTDISIDKIIEAAEEVGAHDFIMNLPGGYDYNVMERGATLSVGQAQLISFIRALVFNPSILVLDEATSSVDTESEMLIQSAIQKLMQGRTSIVIAHRLSTIQNADQIMVLDHGEIVEMGTHQELLHLNGAYKKLYELQYQN